MALFLSPYLLGLFFGYALHVARPVMLHPWADLLRCRIAYSLLGAFVPGIVVIAIVSTTGISISFPGIRGFPPEVGLMFALYFTTTAGIALSAHHLVATRGTRPEKRFFHRVRWILVASVTWVGTFIVLDILLWTPWTSIDYMRVGLWGLVPAGIILLLWLGIAVVRIFRPVDQPDLTSPASKPVIMPTFAPFRG